VLALWELNPSKTHRCAVVKSKEGEWVARDDSLVAMSRLWAGEFAGGSTVQKWCEVATLRAVALRERRSTVTIRLDERRVGKHQAVCGGERACASEAIGSISMQTMCPLPQLGQSRRDLPVSRRYRSR
jgi:hypothetical protein